MVNSPVYKLNNKKFIALFLLLFFKARSFFPYLQVAKVF